MPEIKFVSPSGEKTRKTYVWNENRTELVETGEVDIQKEINAAAVGTGTAAEINRLLKGDTSVLVPAGDGDYSDVSEAPDTYGEIVTAAAEAKAKAASLDAEAKALKAKKAAAEEEIAKKEAALKEEFLAYKAHQAELAALKEKGE